MHDLSCQKKLLSTPAERQRRLEEIPEVIPDAEESKDPEIESAPSSPVQGNQGSTRNIAACLKDTQEISKDAAKQLPISKVIIDEPREAKQLPVPLKVIIDEPREDAIEQFDDSLKVVVVESQEGVTQQVADPLEVGRDESPEGASLQHAAACEVSFEAGGKALYNGGTPGPGIYSPLHNCQDGGGTTQVINIDNGKDENGSRHHVAGGKVVINLDSDDDEDLHMEQRVPERATRGAPEATNRIAACTRHDLEAVNRITSYRHHVPEVANGIVAHRHDGPEAINGVTVPTVCASENLDGITTPACSTMNGATESVKMWHYTDPTGQEQGPHSMDQMRKWQQAGYFTVTFPVWRTGQTRREAILLVDAMRMTF